MDNEVRGRLVEKTFTDKEGISHRYYAIEIDLVTGDTLDIPLKREKANLLLMSLKIESE